MLRVHILYEHGGDLRPHGCSYIRLILPLSHPGNSGTIKVSWGADYEPADVIIIERLWKPVSDRSPEGLVARVRADGCCLIYAMDDNLLDVTTERLGHRSVTYDELMTIRYLMRESDGVIVSTPSLKERLAGLSSNIHVVPNALDERLFNQRPEVVSVEKPRPTTIGYMGTFTHDADLMMILAPLRRFLRRNAANVEFQLIGGCRESAFVDSLKDLPLRLLDPQGNVEYPKFARWMTSNVRWDFSIAPLEESIFTHCKSDIKFLDYSALGIPGIYSNVPAYKNTVRHLETGYLVESDAASWETALERLLSDVALRDNLARNAEQYVTTTRMLKQNFEIWRDAITEIFEQRMAGKQISIGQADIPGLRVDLGCGAARKAGTLGLDLYEGSGVDYVTDLEKEPLPFSDRVVEYVHSSHFLEHIDEYGLLFSEISRVCKEGARLEFWLPYGWHNSAFILGHKMFLNEDIFLHFCVWYVDFWQEVLKARWILEEFQYVIDPKTLVYLYDHKISLPFAIRHMHNVVREFCTFIRVVHSDPDAPSPPIKRTFSTGRFSPRYEIKDEPLSPTLASDENEVFVGENWSRVQEVIRAYAKSASLPSRATERYLMP